MSGASKPATRRRQVVLPEPDRPSIEKNSPSRTVRSTASTATTSPHRLVTPSNRTASRSGNVFSCEVGARRRFPWENPRSTVDRCSDAS